VVPLENDGGDGTAGSHFERTLYFNEVMTGTTSTDMIYSGFTWSVLADSGWYGIDLNNAETFSPGKNSGCGFLNTCKDKNNDGYFC